jgi:hypothetical protein
MAGKRGTDRIRIALLDNASLLLSCCRCEVGERHWDRVAGKAYCPNCQEALVVGESEPLIERTERRQCVVCGRTGTLRYLTFPLNAPAPVEMDICGEHLRGLLGRRLGPFAFHQLRRQLRLLHLQTEDIFLLHGAFYDGEGRALRPAVEIE